MRQFPKILVLVLLVSLIGSTLLFLHSTSDYQNVGTLLHSQTNVLSHELQDEPTAKIEEGYIVHTSHCQIPDVDLWHPSILQYVRNNSPSLACSRIATKPPLTYTEDDMLYINKTNSPFYNGSLLFCEYVEIFRPPNNDFKFDLGHKRVVFTEKVLVKKEFIKVYCYSTNNTLMYQNLHAFTPTKPLLRHMKDNLSLRHKRRGYLEQLNVLMVGLDSVSRLNFHRQFPKTLKILRSKLKAYEMYGYNKVRDNTFINLTPMFLGKYVEETDWNETNNEPFDKYKFAWKRFADAGYHTLFAEDAPSIAIWNFEKEGFHHPPADYYLRPFSLAMASTSSMWTNYKHCFGGRLETDITLEYVYNFIKSRQRAPHFAFTFLTRPTYDSVNQNTDQSHAKFLESMIRSRLLENTILIYFSDHGIRRGDILSTYIGKLEERLPAMFISLPDWFARKYPQIAQNLEVNQHRLTTPFDINALLDNVLRFTGIPKHPSANMRSISLFDKVPQDRSCASATIDDHWCTCLQQQPASVSDKKVIRAAKVLIGKINKKTAAHHKVCARYKLDEITDALQATPTHKLMTFKLSMNDVIGRKEYYGEEAIGRVTMYHVTIRVKPSGGVFQGTVKYDSTTNSYRSSGYISRTNAYGSSSSCVKDHSLKKYCYCKELM